MEKRGFYAVMVLTGVFTALFGAVFFIGNEATYQKLLETPISSFCGRWIGVSLLGSILFLTCFFLQWLLAKIIYKEPFQEILKVCLIGIMVQFISAFVGTYLFFNH